MNEIPGLKDYSRRAFSRSCHNLIVIVVVTGWMTFRRSSALCTQTKTRHITSITDLGGGYFTPGDETLKVVISSSFRCLSGLLSRYPSRPGRLAMAPPSSNNHYRRPPLLERGVRPPHQSSPTRRINTRTQRVGERHSHSADVRRYKGV